MRLTLRTLLAWLDDTLPPAEVKQIGQMVSESPFAQELVERIRKVTRQRRLSVPNGQGVDGSDPNLVAEYLDNVLPSDKVAEFETLCLKSDVHLAEVASTHQILSLIGQKAKVPVEARSRMYRLIKGPEAARRLAGPVSAVAVPQKPIDDSFADTGVPKSRGRGPGMDISPSPRRWACWACWDSPPGKWSAPAQVPPMPASWPPSCPASPRNPATP